MSADVVYEPVIGLEVHAQLLTQSKLFCGCATAFGASPNAQTCAICLGMPGVLPVVNKQAIVLAIHAALGLDCTVQLQSEWARKNYFYPDLPKGYQITQDKKPIALGGALRVDVDGKSLQIGITRIHIEEDAGKNIHDDMLAGKRSYVDFNRGGTPLIEIVSEPDLRSSAAAAAYLKTLRQILRYLDVCDGNMDEGSLRCDANVSIRPVGVSQFGTRVELKNINSFKFVQAAIDYEIARQTACLQRGECIMQETRLWDTQAKATRSMRSKEEARDYRYFPEPDLPEIVLDAAYVEHIKQHMKELPAAKMQRYVGVLGLSPYDAKVLTDDQDVAHFFEQAIIQSNNYKAVANWIINELLREIKDKPLRDIPLTGVALGRLIELIDNGTISGKIAKDVFAQLLQHGGDPRLIVQQNNLMQLSDVASIEPLVIAILAQHQDSVAAYRAGKTNILGFFVKEIMAKTSSRANPKIVSELLKKHLSTDNV